MRKTFLLCAMLSVLLGAAGIAWSATIPYGVMNDVSYDKITKEWGWSVAYRGDYKDTATFDQLFGKVGRYVMLAAIKDGSSAFDVLAAAELSAVTTVTGTNQTHESNGALWYYNGLSMGFAGLGDVIYQSSADINGQSERDRLSWHTNWAYPGIMYGWRSGNNVWLNESTDWDRVVLTYDGGATVPEPSTMLLLGGGLMSLAVYARRRKHNS